MQDTNPDKWGWNEKVKGYTRPNTLDEYIFKEIKSSYSCLDIQESDIILDIGANIGAFSKYAMEKGAFRVYAYEPEPDNYELLVINTGGAGHILRFQRAVVGTDQTEIELYINSKKNKGLHMTREVRGRDSISVKAENFYKIMFKLKPNKIKIDVEGAEYGIMPVSSTCQQIPDFVEKIVMELHFQYNKEWRPLAIKMHENMLKQGFSVIKEPQFKGKNWTTLVGYSR